MAARTIDWNNMEHIMLASALWKIHNQDIMNQIKTVNPNNQDIHFLEEIDSVKQEDFY